MRILSALCLSTLFAAPAYAQLHVEINAPPPPRIVISAPPPPRVYVAPPPRVVVAPPPRVYVAPPVVRVALPTVRFEAPPPLAIAAPGVEVVEDCDEEVFFVDGYYWHEGPSGWFRTRSYRGGWVAAPHQVVPTVLVNVPRGHYRHFRGEHRGGRREERREERHDERRIEHREERGRGHGGEHGGHHGRRG